MENEPVGPVVSTSKSPRSLRYWLIVGAIVLTVGALGYLLISKLTSTTDNSGTEKVLTIKDLDNPSVKLNSTTSDVSVDNLTKELKAKIDKQIAAKDNPIDTVTTLIGVLCTTTNAKRQNQCIDYVTGFLDTKMDALKLNSDTYGKPDELQITYWRAQLYAYLVNSYKSIMDNKFIGSDGRTIDTSKEQLKYIDLYLAIAQNSANWGEPQVSKADGHTWYYYDYQNTSDFVLRRKQLEAGGA